MSIPNPATRCALLAAAWLVCGALLLALPAGAQSVRLIPFQGRVTDGAGAPLEGVFRLTFTIYDNPVDGPTLWTETHPGVSILAGQVNVLLGSITDLDDPNGDGTNPVRFDTQKFLGIKVGAGSNQEMVPRHELVPSFHARMADTTVDGGVGTDQLAEASVTGDKLADASVNIVKLTPGLGLPVGAVIMWWGETVPDGFELCDGQLPQDPDAVLAIRKPDLRNRFPQGHTPGAAFDADNPRLGGVEAIAGGRTGETALTEAQMPSHTHDLVSIQGQVDSNTAPPNILGTNSIQVNFGNAIAIPVPDNMIFTTTEGSDASHDHAGSGHDNRPPYVEIFFIIRVK